MRKIPLTTMPAKPNLPKSSISRPVSSLRVVSFLKLTRRFFGFFMPHTLHRGWICFVDYDIRNKKRQMIAI